MEPKNFPAFKEASRNSQDYPVDWLNQDSIDSLKQTSQAINFAPP